MKQLSPRPLPKTSQQINVSSTKQPERNTKSPISETVSSVSKTTSTRPVRKSIIRIKPQSNTEEIDAKISHGNEVFTNESLVNTWNSYVNHIKKTSGGFTTSVLVNCEPVLKEDNHTVHLVFRNETNEIEFNKLALDLLEHLKKELKNDHINFSTEVNKAKAKKTLYTNKEKFDHLAEKHPELNDWLQKLKLELK